MKPANPAKKSLSLNKLAGVCLVIVTLALFWPATTFNYIQFDDGAYVFQNPVVTKGLTAAGLKWAFTAIHIANWHPLTWISHMIDYAVFGPFPGGHHLTNILLHTANTLLLFLLLKFTTKSTGASFVVAALFGWHPAHVESVAWIAERKDVLSTFFFLLTLIAYARYAVEPQKTRRRKIYFALSLVLFAFGLMAKQMVVTLPFLLLLMDYWPLQRIYDLRFAIYEPKAEGSNHEEIGKLLWEKIPFFVLAFAGCAATLHAQGIGAIRTTADVTLSFRVFNALASYAKYVGEAFWPSNLSIYYLLPNAVETIPAGLGALLLVAVSIVAFRLRSRMPWLAVGWLWFLGTLVPVIGLVQVGSQEMADRYTYIPFIGLFIAVVWSFARILAISGNARTLGPSLATPILIACVLFTYRQLAFWRDDVSLFGHAVEATPGSFFAEFEFGLALEKADRLDEAANHYAASLQANPVYEPAHYRIGIVLTEMGKLDDAAFHFSEALKRDPNSEQLHNVLGVVYSRQGKATNAIAEFKEAIRLNPDYPQPYVNYGDELQKLGQTAEALTNYYRAQALAPDAPEALDKLARLLATCPDPNLRNPAAAFQFAQRASDLTQNQDPVYLGTLAAANAATGNYSNAVKIAESARSRANELHLTNEVLKLEHDLAAYRQNRSPDAQAP